MRESLIKIKSLVWENMKHKLAVCILANFLKINSMARDNGFVKKNYIVEDFIMEKELGTGNERMVLKVTVANGNKEDFMAKGYW